MIPAQFWHGESVRTKETRKPFTIAAAIQNGWKEMAIEKLQSKSRRNEGLDWNYGTANTIHRWLNRLQK